MNLTPLLLPPKTRSMFTHAGYEGHTQVMRARHLNGKEYEWSPCTGEQFERFMKSGNIGVFGAAHRPQREIRKNG